MKTREKIAEIMQDPKKTKDIAITLGVKYYNLKEALETMQKSGYIYLNGEFFRGEKAVKEAEKIKGQMEVLEEILGDYLEEEVN